MLAYVFWHWHEPNLDREGYAQRLLAFHRGLGEGQVPGFQGSAVLQGGPTPWTAGALQVYEDWYLLEDSAGLDALNEAAVAAQRQALHDGIAALAAGGTAGLYRLRQGTPTLAAPLAYWFAKPAHMAYGQLYELLSQTCSRPETGLWGRQMVLGPTPEFCLLAARETELPSGLQALKLERQLMWTAVR